MHHRHLLRVVTLSAMVGLGVSAAWLWAADAPPATEPAAATAQQLLQQGLDEYAKGDYAAAKTTLDRIDEMQLSKEDRVKLYEVRQDLDRSPSKAKNDPSAMLQQAGEAQAAGQLDKAASLYQNVAASDAATPREKDTATARLAEVKRSLKSQLAHNRELIAQAATDIGASRLDDAEKKLQAVKASGVDMGWYDTERLNRMSAQVADLRQENARLAAAAEPATPAASPSSSSDVTEVTAATTQPAPVAEAKPAEPVAAAPAAQPAKAAEPAAPAAAVQPEPTATPVAEQPAPAPAPAPAAVETTAAAPVAPAAEKPTDDLLVQARILRSQELVEQGRANERAGQYRLAVEHYQEAIRLDPDNKDAKNLLGAAQAKVNNLEAPSGALETQITTNTLREQAVIADIQSLLNRADSLRKEGKYANASEAAEQAKIELDRNEQVLPTARYQALHDQAVALSDAIQKEREQAEVTQKAAISQQQKQEAEAARQDALRAQDEEVQRLLVRARALQRQQKYDQSLELINQALFLDPNNLAAQLMKEIVEDNRGYVQAKDLERKRAVEIARQSVDNTEATIPFDQIIVYPSDWPQLTVRRLNELNQGSAESKLNQEVAAKLKEPVRIEFQANKLVNVIDYLRNTTGLNFFVNWNALQQAGVEQEAPITLDLVSVPAEQALRLVLQQVGTDETNPIQFSIINGVVTIDTQRNLTKTVEVRTYDIKDLLHRIDPVANVPKFDLGSALNNTNSSGSGGTGGTNGGTSGSSSSGGSSGSSSSGLFGNSSTSTQTTVDQTAARKEQVDAIIKLMEDTVGKPDDWQSKGGTVSSESELNGNLIVKTTPENHRQIVDLLTRLRETRAMQIAVEGRFLLVDQNFLDEVGIDLDVQINNPGGKFGPIQINQDTVGLAARQTTSVPGSFPAASSSVPGTFQPGVGFPATGRSLTIGASYMDDLQVNLIVTATQASHRAITLNAPRVTFINGNDAYVTVARQISFVSALTPIPNTSGFQTTLSYVQDGMTMYVRGTISADRRYVTLTCQPQLATVVQPIRQIQQTAVPTTAAVATAVATASTTTIAPTITGFIEAPEVEITEVQTTVSVPDKGTLLLGGQRLVGESEVEAGVPVLSKIPILNRLFTNRSSVKDERTLLILIKPTIIIQNEEEEDLFPGLLANPQNYNVGSKTQ